MSWSYGADPANSAGDAVRFLCGQTSTGDDVLLTDEEIAYLVAQYSDTRLAAAGACEALAKQYAARKPNAESLGGWSANWGDRAKSLLDQAGNLRKQVALKNVTAWVGGISQADMATYTSDSDRVTPSFSVGMHDNPGTASTTT